MVFFRGISPPHTCIASFEVNSEPYTGARPSVRLRVGLFSRGVEHFEIIETKSLFKRRELAAEMHGARQWWSFLEGLSRSSWPGRGLGLEQLLCV